MSLVYNDYINSLERGYYYSDKKLCHECIGNKSLKEYIKVNGTLCICDYCGQKRKAINLDSFMPIIMSGISFLYSRAIEELPCDSGEYVGKTYTTEQAKLFIDSISDKKIDELEKESTRSKEAINNKAFLPIIGNFKIREACTVTEINNAAD